MTREEVMALLSEYLIGQATNPSWYYTASPAELETVYKDYIKSRPEYMDTVTPFYRSMGNDPVAQQMFNWFSLIASKERNAAGIIADAEAGNIEPLTEEQKADLRTFESEQEKRNEAAIEQYVNAEIYGLPTPDASGWDIPMEALEQLAPIQKDGTTELSAQQRALRQAQKIYSEADQAYKNPANLEQGPMVGQGRRLDPGYKKNWTSALWNDTLGRVLGEVDRDVAPDPVRKPTREVTQARNTAYVVKKAMENAVNESATYTQRLAEEIAKKMVEKYGTPYEAAITTARRLAEEEATKKYGPKTSGSSGGSSGLSDWEKEQERKRRLFEGRGI